MIKINLISKKEQEQLEALRLNEQFCIVSNAFPKFPVDSVEEISKGRLNLLHMFPSETIISASDKIKTAMNLHLLNGRQAEKCMCVMSEH